MGNEHTNRIVHAPGIETNQGKLAMPPIVRYNIGAEDTGIFSENLVVPLEMLLPKHHVL